MIILNLTLISYHISYTPDSPGAPAPRSACSEPSATFFGLLISPPLQSLPITDRSHIVVLPTLLCTLKLCCTGLRTAFACFPASWREEGRSWLIASLLSKAGPLRIINIFCTALFICVLKCVCGRVCISARTSYPISITKVPLSGAQVKPFLRLPTLGRFFCTKASHCSQCSSSTSSAGSRLSGASHCSSKSWLKSAQPSFQTNPWPTPPEDHN